MKQCYIYTKIFSQLFRIIVGGLAFLLLGKSQLSGWIDGGDKRETSVFIMNRGDEQDTPLTLLM